MPSITGLPVGVGGTPGLDVAAPATVPTLDTSAGFQGIAPAPTPQVTVAMFRAAYPAFNDLTVYQPDAINFWIAEAYERLDAGRWGNLLRQGVLFFVAHQLALNTAGGAAGNPGVISSKSVGGVSVAYNMEVGSVAGSGAWNQTVYGRQFIQLVSVVGIGGLQL